jgi:hypothetical protein
MGFRQESDSNKPEESDDALRLEDPENAEDRVRVNLDDANEPEDGDDVDEDKTPSDKPKGPNGEQPRRQNGTWAEKKAARGNDRKAAKAWETEKADYERRIQRVQEENDRRYNDLRAEMERSRQAPQQGQQRQDPFEAKLADIDAQLDAELKLIEADDKRPYTRYNQLRRQEQEAITQRAIAQAELARQQHQARQPQNPNAGRQPIISAEFPWTDDPRYNDLGRKAFAYKTYLVEVEGRPDTLDTDREALQSTVARFGGEFGLRPPPAAPTPRTRQMYGGPASRSAPDRRPAPREVELGVLGQGTGLSARTLAAAVDAALKEEQGGGRNNY